MIMHTRIAPPREIKAILERVSGDAGHARHLLAAAGSLPEDMLTVWSRTSPALDAGGAYALEGNHQRECPPRVDDGRGWSRRHIAVPVLHVVPFPKFHTADSEAGSADAGVQSRKRGRADGIPQRIRPVQRLPQAHRADRNAVCVAGRHYKAREAEIKALQAMINPIFSTIPWTS